MKEFHMTILTIEEAAEFLRLSRRTLYRLKDLPRVRYAGKLVYVKEDLEVWVRVRMEGEMPSPKAQVPRIELSRAVGHHRNALYEFPAKHTKR
jgi:excisionase family DNA binding protein